MAPNYIFSKTIPSSFSRLFCRYRFPFEGLQSQWFSTKTLTSVSDDSTVSYLVNSCGLSPEAAIEASHKVKLQSLEKPNSVLALLREYEFSDTQISTLVRRHPCILVAKANKTLLPKLEFLSSIGLSRLDLATSPTYSSLLLGRSLENTIKHFFKSVVGSDVNVVNIWKHNSWIVRLNLSKYLVPNIGILRELGMSQFCIALLLTHYSRLLMRKPELFSQLVSEVQQLGFDPQKSSFLQAMIALCGKETTWKRCEEAYRSWGWSDSDIVSAFRLSPLCMTKSEKKIMATMDFLVNKIGWKAGKIVKYPHVFTYSLEKRIIPRCLVVRVLLLKGLIKEKQLSLATVLSPSEKHFLNKFVTRYFDQVPQLSDVYQGKMDVQDV